MGRIFVLSFISSTVCVLLLLVVVRVSEAQVMTSSNYQIQSDSLNVGGNDTSSSSNYSLKTTLGEVGTGPSNSASYSLGAGYRQMQEVYIALSGTSDITMDPPLQGVSGGTSNGSTTVTVITDSPSGYALTITFENDPAMKKGADTIADYAPGASPSFDFDVNTGEAFFGFSPEGDHIISRYLDNGSTCNTGGTFDNHLQCWDAPSTTALTIASDTNSNHPNGATTTIYFRVELGAQTNTPPGTYVATTTVTALPL